MYHETANGRILARTYQETADRARGFAYYLKKHGYARVGILCSNTPAFLEGIFGVAAAEGVNVGMFNLSPTYLFVRLSVRSSVCSQASSRIFLSISISICRYVYVYVYMRTYVTALAN